MFNQGDEPFNWSQDHRQFIDKYANKKLIFNNILEDEISDQKSLQQILLLNVTDRIRLYSEELCLKI